MTSPMDTAREALEKIGKPTYGIGFRGLTQIARRALRDIAGAEAALTPSVSDTVNAGLGSVGTSPSPTDGEGAVAPRIGFMCKVDFDYDIESSNGADVYPTIEMLRRRRRCVDECGIVKVEVRLLSVEQEEDFSAYLGPPSEHPVGEGFMPTEPNTSNPPPDKAVLGGMGERLRRAELLREHPAQGANTQFVAIDVETRDQILALLSERPAAEEDNSSRAVPLKTIIGPIAHNWVRSTLGHAETMCERCGITNREAAILGENECLPAPPALPQDVETKEGGVS